MPARALLGAANGVCKEVHLLPVQAQQEQQQLENGEERGALLEEEYNAIAPALDQSVHALRTKFMREQAAHAQNLAQQDLAQQIAWGQMEAGTSVVDMACVSGPGGAEAGSVIFTATVHEPHKKITEPDLRTNEVEGSESAFGEVTQDAPPDDDALEARVYSILECHAQSAELTRGGGVGTSMRVRGLRWTEGASVCVGRTQEPASAASASGGQHSDSEVEHIAGRVAAISVLPFEMDGHRETCLLSCTSSGEVRLHRVVQSEHELVHASAAARSVLRSSVRPISQILLGNVGARAQVMRLGHVSPAVVDKHSTSGSGGVTITFDVLTGGQEHDLQIHRFQVIARRVAGNLFIFESGGVAQRVFRAKNLPDDRYRLRPKVWITDMHILSRTPADRTAQHGSATVDATPTSHYRVACVTKYGQYRLFDTSVRRRCIINIEKISEHPLQCLAVADFRALLEGSAELPELTALRKTPVFLAAGDSVGSTFQLDPNTGAVVAKYKQNSAGALRRNSLAFTIGFVRKSGKNGRPAPPNSSAFDVVPLLLSAGLDRTLRCHHALTRRLLHRVFVKQQINCVLPLPIEFPAPSQLTSEPVRPDRRRRRRRRDYSDSGSDDGDWGHMDEADILASVRSAPADELVHKIGGAAHSRRRHGDEEGSGVDSGEIDDDLEAAAALAVVETQMNSVREKSGKNLSASRSETARRVRSHRERHDREKREYEALSGSSNRSSGKSRDSKRTRR